MNYLAHLFLSGNDEEIIIGNFIGDYVKGHNFADYPENVAKGIILHRNIDMFTDTSAIVRASKSRFLEKYGKYSGILVDILYDHFLTKNWSAFTQRDIQEFILNAYLIIEQNFVDLPGEVQGFVPSFINNSWLSAYRSIGGIHHVLRRMSKRTSFPDHTEYAISVLENEYDFLDEEFMSYFPTLMDFVSRKFNINFRE